ncbi:MAG: flagellar motor switch protein FliN [Nitrospinota bacterium]
MGDEENKEEAGEELEDISWEDAAADLDKQREMLKEAAEKGDDDDAAPEYPVALQGEEQVKPVSQEESGKIGRILDIPLKVTVELGRTRMLINDLLQLGQGSVIELSKLVKEPLSVMINEKTIGQGEVVVINEKFGIRLTEITTPTERIESLK